MEDYILKLLTKDFNKDIKRTELPYGASIKLVLEMIVELSGLDKKYILVDVKDDIKLKRKWEFNGSCTYISVIKDICREYGLDVSIDNNGLLIQ